MHLAVLPARWLYSDLDILAKGGEKIHQTLDRKVPGLPAHQTRNMRLLDAKDLSRCRLGESTVFDQPVDLQREAGLNLLTFGVGETQVSKNLAAASFDPNLAIFPPFHFPFLCIPFLPPHAAV